MRIFAMLAAALLSAPVASAQRASPAAGPDSITLTRTRVDTTPLWPGTRVRLRRAGEREWRVGRLDAVPHGVVRLRACTTCEAHDYPLDDVREMQWSTGRGRNAGFYGAVTGLPIGFLAGALLVGKTYRCAGELCGLGPMALGAVAGAVVGATAGGIGAARAFEEHWRPVLLPGPR